MTEPEVRLTTTDVLRYLDAVEATPTAPTRRR